MTSSQPAIFSQVRCRRCYARLFDARRAGMAGGRIDRWNTPKNERDEDMTKRFLLVLLVCLAGLLGVSDGAPLSSAPAALRNVELDANACIYPLLHALASNNTRSIATDKTMLDAIASQYDAATISISSADWTITGTGLTVPQYLEKVKPGMDRWVYIPGGFFYPLGLFDCNNHPALCGASKVVIDSDWLRKPDGGYVVAGSGRFINPTTDAQARLGAYWEAWAAQHPLIDGIHFDLMTTTMDREGGNVDTNRNGISDRYEFGLKWLDAQWQASQIERQAELTGVRSVGNGAWQPGGEAYQPWVDGVFAELAHTYRNPATGQWSPARPNVLRWQLEQLQAWREAKPSDTIMVIASESRVLLDDPYWKKYWNDFSDTNRLALALALLVDGEFVLPAHAMPGWCDECGVKAGRTSTSPGTGDWLGCPQGPTRCDGNLCWREFDNGAVFLNLSPDALKVAVPTGYRTIRGWYDTAVNHGGAWNGTLPGHNAQVLWRTATPRPTATPTRRLTPTPTVTATSTPTATPTATPTLSIEQRLDRIEARIDALETRTP